MRLISNNTIAFMAVVLILMSLTANTYLFAKTKGIEGAATIEGNVQMCINHPPVINYTCNNTAYVGYRYFCNIDAYGDAGQSLTFYDNTSLFNINSSTGVISFVPTLLDEGVYYVNLTAVDNSSCSNYADHTTFTLGVRARIIDISLAITKTGQHGVFLNWTNVPAAIKYNVVYSENARNIRIIDTPSNYTNISGIATNYWNDTTAYLARKRFYRVYVVFFDEENVSRRAVGKHDVDFVVNSDGSLGRKLFSIPFNRTYYVADFIREICNYSATVTRLNRDNPNFENYEAHSCNSGSYNNFSMGLSDAFYIYINRSYNYTLTGPMSQDNITIKLISSDDGSLGRNLFGLHYPLEDPYADPFLTDDLCSYSATITQLNRDNPNLENYESHSCNSGSYNNFSILSGEGYFLYVNRSYNFTIQ